MATDPTTTQTNISRLELARRMVQKCDRDYTRAFRRWCNDRSDKNHEAMVAAATAYRNWEQVLASAKYIVKYNHGRMPTVNSSTKEYSS